jgi:RecJ-like exonuclease
MTKWMCNVCGQVYDSHSRACECHPDVIEVDDDGDRVCSFCHGRGWVKVMNREKDGGTRYDCPECDGTGKKK